MPSWRERYDLDLSALPLLAGKTLVVTGGTAGLGAKSIRILSAQSSPPAHIAFLGRNAERANALISEINSAHPNVKLTFVPCDLSSFDSIDVAAKTLLSSLDRIDVFFGVAGIMAVCGMSKDGYEAHFGTNHLGHALLLKHLLPLISSTAKEHGDARIVLNTSEGMLLAPKGGIQFDTLRDERTDSFWGNWAMYAQSKLANILYARHLAKEYPDIKSVAVHPGVIMTDLVTGLDWRYRWFVWATTIGFRVTEDQGAMNGLWAITSEKSKLGNGQWYVPTGVEGAHSEYSNDDALAKRLWDWTQAELKDRAS